MCFHAWLLPFAMANYTDRTMDIHRLVALAHNAPLDRHSGQRHFSNERYNFLCKCLECVRPRQRIGRSRPVTWGALTVQMCQQI